MAERAWWLHRYGDGPQDETISHRPLRWMRWLFSRVFRKEGTDG